MRAYYLYMKIITDYINYLRDNPEGYWFKRKLYGWGWTPARREGWLVIGAYLIVILVLAVRVDEATAVEDLWTSFFIPLIAATALLIAICYLKGESPRWQWGPGDIDRTK